MSKVKYTVLCIFGVVMIFALMMCVSGCSHEPVKIKALIVAKFETGEMSGDDIGEAQLFYEEYCGNSDEYDLANGDVLYVNSENCVAVGVSGYGKAQSASFYASVLSDSRFDFSDAYILNVGCCGASYETAVLDDVILATWAVDYDFGYKLTVSSDGESELVWVRDPDLDDIAVLKMDSALTDRVYGLVFDTELTSAESGFVWPEDMAGEEPAAREPGVIKGVTVTSDSYWKGIHAHDRAVEIVKSYGIEDEYCSTEMEDTACAGTVSDFGMLDHFINLRVAVNLDILADDETAGDYADAVSADVSPEVFSTGMENLFAVGSRIVDAVIDGSL